MVRSRQALKAAGPLIAALLCASPVWAQDYYSQYYSFGDSLSDTGRVLRETGFNGPAIIANLFQAPGIYNTSAGIFSNGPVFLQVLPALVGTTYKPGNNYGIGFANSGDQPPFALTSPTFPLGFKNQIDQFIARGGGFGARDVVNVWFGYNDISAIPDGTAAQISSGIQTVYGNIGAGIQRLAALGGRNFVVFDTQTYRSGVQSPIAAQYNAGFVAAVLQPLADQGLNIHFFDVAALADRFRANPTAYGFAADAGTVDCIDDPVCRANGASTGLENQYISPEGIHFTGRANEIIAAYVANQLNAPLSIGPETDMAEGAGDAFTGTLVDTLGLEGRSATPTRPGERFSVFAFGDFLDADRRLQGHADGSATGEMFDADFGGVTFGLLYDAAPGVRLGAAFNYARSATDLTGLSGGYLRLNTYQGAIFASLASQGSFLDVAASYGGDDFSLSRPGVYGDLQASPSGDTVAVTSRVGHLFAAPGLKIGPIGELAYTDAHVDPYQEGGDSLLTIGVRGQRVDRLSLGAGFQARSRLRVGGVEIEPVANLTARRDVLEDAHTVTSYQTYAPSLLIRTEAGAPADGWYGRFAGGFNVIFPNNLTVNVNGATSFTRTYAQDRYASLGIVYHF